MSGTTVRVLSGTGILGYGFDEVSLGDGRCDGMDLVACDAGSTDGGPFYLGTGTGIVSSYAVRRDLGKLWQSARDSGAPLVIGNCGGSGTDVQLSATLEIVRTIAAENRWSARVAVIHSELSVDAILAALHEDRIEPLDSAPTLDEETVRSSAHTVAMMGTEPVAAALEAGADVVLAGRISDAAIFAALPIMRGIDPGTAWHAGKLLECGATCAVPPGPDCMIAELAPGSFTLQAPNPARRCTEESVMTFALHETPHMFLHQECGGVLDLTNVEVEEIGDGRVTMRGARFGKHAPTVRLEGASVVGHRTVLIAATRDPRLIARIDEYLERTRAACAEKMAAGGISEDSYKVNVYIYGRDGVLGPLETCTQPSHELCLVVAVVADSADVARAVTAAFRSLLLHSDFDGRQCTEGNFALPFSPSELDGGEAYTFSIWHSLRIDDPLALFPIEYHGVGHP